MTSELDLIFGPSPELSPSPAPAPLPDSPSAARFTVIKGEYIAHITIPNTYGTPLPVDVSCDESRMIRYWDEALDGFANYADTWAEVAKGIEAEFSRCCEEFGFGYVAGVERDLVWISDNSPGYCYPNQGYKAVGGFTSGSYKDDNF